MEPTAALPPVSAQFAAQANTAIPELITVSEKPVGVVRVEKDESELLGWRVVNEGRVQDMPVLQPGDSTIIDFGGHRTGYLSFRLQPYKSGPEPADSPCRLRLVFGEIVSDVAEEFEPYNAWLSKAWLPDEIITVDYLPQQVRIPRRHAFRFVKFEIIATSRRYGVKIESPLAHAVSSVSPETAAAVAPLDFSLAAARALGLSGAEQAMLEKIDEVALRTLRNCMLTVYEDGPRRDMRLWIGDLRLQALTNYSTFGDLALARRCLYLFAATPYRADGLLSASCYEKPQILSGGQSIVDFAHLYAAALLDYVRVSGDEAAGRELLATATRQYEISLKRCDAQGVYTCVERDEGFEGPEGNVWHFIDWHQDLEKACAEHCVLIFGLRSLLSLYTHLSLPPPTLSIPSHTHPLPLPDLIAHLTSIAHSTFFSPALRACVSGPKAQLSWASNAWAVLARVLTGDEARVALRTAYESAESVKANTPYLHHYLVEAMIEAGMGEMAVRHVLRYWGSMVRAGAETFWEAWDEERPTFSPYGDFHSNSFCHAWSCTPSLLLRRLFKQGNA